MKKILFVCKYNRFRSRVAEAYFKKINENKNWLAESAGIFRGHLPLSKIEVREAKKLGVDILGEPKSINEEELLKKDLVIVVANDVPREIFNLRREPVPKIIVWKVKDGYSVSPEKIPRIIKKIMKKVDKLVRKLK